jgi:quinol monooxygenase YgiN
MAGAMRLAILFDPIIFDLSRKGPIMSAGNPIGAVATVTAQEGQADTLLDALKESALASREEPGCLMYEIHEDLDKPGTFVLFERWADSEALQAHMGMDHTRKFMKTAGPVLAAPPVITKLRPIKG